MNIFNKSPVCESSFLRESAHKSLSTDDHLLEGRVLGRLRKGVTERPGDSEVAMAMAITNPLIDQKAST